MAVGRESMSTPFWAGKLILYGLIAIVGWIAAIGGIWISIYYTKRKRTDMTAMGVFVTLNGICMGIIFTGITLGWWACHDGLCS
jgi:hypothetical protein